MASKENARKPLTFTCGPTTVTGKIMLDGKDISVYVRGITIEANVDTAVPLVLLEMIPDWVTVELEDVEVRRLLSDLPAVGTLSDTTPVGSKNRTYAVRPPQPPKESLLSRALRRYDDWVMRF